jgi:hypothetical protein
MLLINSSTGASLNFSFQKKRVILKHLSHTRPIWIKEDYFQAYRPQLDNLFRQSWQNKPKRFKENSYYNLILKNGELLIGFLYRESVFHASSYKPVRQVKSSRAQFFTESL